MKAASSAALTNEQADLGGPQPSCLLALVPARFKQQQRSGGPAGVDGAHSRATGQVGRGQWPLKTVEGLRSFRSWES